MSKALSHPFYLMRLPEVQKISGLSKASIYRHMKAGNFPSSVRVGGGSVAWRSTDITDWLVGLE